MNKLIRNEQRKLKASFYNGVAVAAVGIGGLSQAAGMVQSAYVVPAIPFFVVICLSSAYLLHMVGRAALTELEE